MMHYPEDIRKDAHEIRQLILKHRKTRSEPKKIFYESMIELCTLMLKEKIEEFEKSKGQL